MSLLLNCPKRSNAGPLIFIGDFVLPTDSCFRKVSLMMPNLKEVAGAKQDLRGSKEVLMGVTVMARSF